MPNARGLFITGTGTGVGKTYVTALIAKQLVAAGVRVGVYKPVSSGCVLKAGEVISTDAVALWEAAGQPGELERVSPQRFLAPLAPHLAARAEGRSVDSQLLRDGLEYWIDRSEIVLVEVAGGLMSPLAVDRYNADLAHELGFPLIVVAANELGTINHTLQTLIAAATCSGGIPVAGVVLNQVRPLNDDASIASNLDELRLRADVPVLVSVSHGMHALPERVAWERLAAPVSS